MATQQRDYALAERLSRLGDCVLIDAVELAALTGFAWISIQQERVKGLPKPVGGLGRKKWRLGDVRAWIGVEPGKQLA